MNITILAINSKYIHSSLSLWYLTAACADCGKITPLEHSINEPRDRILRSICQSKPDVLAISCYIWNIEIVTMLCRDLKALLPDLKIILGGPEATFRAHELMSTLREVDFVILGEGEITLPALLKGDIPDGVVMRSDGDIVQIGDYQYVENLDSLASPYTPQMIASLNGKLAYYESSRGCPFSCSYCLSCATHGVRNVSIERVKSDITKLISSNVQTIKFVDRTFNANLTRAKEIVRFLLSLDFQGTFHFEVGADLFDDELLALLKSAPPGRFQIEAGIQSTHEPTLDAVCRTTDTRRALNTIREISLWGSVHVHADLICGLPHEDLQTFAHSFDELYNAHPHALQLGFLKLLHGSRLHREANKYDYICSPFAPYEIRCNNVLSADDVFLLHDVEDALDRFYNSGRFSVTLSYLTTCFSSPFALYRELSSRLVSEYGIGAPVSPDKLFEFLANFCRTHPDIDFSRAMSALSFDYYCSFKTRMLPEFLEEPKDMFSLIVDGKIEEFSNMPIKDAAKQTLVKSFPFDMSIPSLPKKSCIYLISRRDKDPVSARFITQKINLDIAL